MAAFFIAPFYVFINIYIVRWMFLWMGSCHYLFQTHIFRIVFAGVYILLATSLLTGFLIQKPLWLHRFLKNVGNYFLGTFLYILLVIITVDAGRLILKYLFHRIDLFSSYSFSECIWNHSYNSGKSYPLRSNC